MSRPSWRASALAAACAALTACGGPAADAPHDHLIVPKHTTLAAVTDSLVAHGIVTSPRAFRAVARVLGAVTTKFHDVDRRLRPGRYEFPHGERWTVILSAFITGRTDDELFTVPEGATIREIAGEAHRRLGMDSAAFVAVTRDAAFHERLGVPADVRGIEGYLFPETYRVPYDAEPQQLVAHMVREFLTVWDTAWDRLAADSLGMSRHEVLTLASIVEAEAKVPRERPIIAGVYLNRLRRRVPMKLQADPTVIYALGKPVRRVLLRHLSVPSPYNTYLHYGLPPGPIDNPGKASILAVLHPARHRYLFFVARPDGTNMFTSSPHEHADSVAVARRLRAEAATPETGKTPH
ncbi:MAG: endolytic transglycosylase MltG [Gemmatimonadales bacterium]